MQVLESFILIITRRIGTEDRLAYYLGTENTIMVSENLCHIKHITKHPNLPLTFEYPCNIDGKTGKIMVTYEATNDETKEYGDKCYNVWTSYNKGVDVSLNTSTKKRSFEFANFDESDNSSSSEDGLTPIFP